MMYPTYSLWRAGFRPFFTMACVAGALLPALWALSFSGLIVFSSERMMATAWHAHEMFFGFGWAVLGGFLLTATKNWVQIRGFHGKPLMFLAMAWCVERVVMLFGTSWSPLLFHILVNLFLASIVGMLLWTLVRHRRTDSYRHDNYFFLVALPVFIVAKNLLLDPDFFREGWSMTLGLFRMAFLIMLERTLSQFMSNVFQVTVLRHPLLDRFIKFLGLVMIFEVWLPVVVASGVAAGLAFLLAVRLMYWYPHHAVRRIDIGIMFLGYIGIVVQLILPVIGQSFSVTWVGTFSVHTFTFCVMGWIIPGMLIRISKGHTGRKVVFDAGDKALLWLMIGAAWLRLVMPQILPGHYIVWIVLAAACWLVCFTVLGWRYIPFLWQPRIDGKDG